MSGLAALVWGLVQVFSYEGKNITSRSEMMESILSISSEIVDFQESDNLLVDEAFKILCSLWEESRSADIWMDQISRLSL